MPVNMYCRALDGRVFRLLSVLDDFNRAGRGIDVDVSLHADRIIEWRGKPGTIKVFNGLTTISGKPLI